MEDNHIRGGGKTGINIPVMKEESLKYTVLMEGEELSCVLEPA